MQDRIGDYDDLQIDDGDLVVFGEYGYHSPGEFAEDEPNENIKMNMSNSQIATNFALFVNDMKL